MTASHFLQMRDLEPSGCFWNLTFAGESQLGQICTTLDIEIGISLSIIPACLVPPVARACFLERLVPSTRSF